MKTKVVCNGYDCQYNNGGVCTRKEIAIGVGHRCNMFLLNMDIPPVVKRSIEIQKEMEAEGSRMTNVFESDFTYSKRFGLEEPFGYLFKVRGESANYLMNKYCLNYANVFVNCYSHDCVFVSSRTDDKMQGDCADDCDEDDAYEIYEAVKSVIVSDSKNYAEYLANNDYYAKDSRWE